VEWGKLVSKAIRDKGFWADLADPASGYPVLGERGGMAYSDIDGIAVLLPYDQQQVGGCGVVSHPVWHTAVYPATMFTTAPLEVLQDAIQQLETLPT